MAASTPTPTSPAAVTIATAASLPPRVRRILGVLFTQASADFRERTNHLLGEFDQRLVRRAEQARSNDLQSALFLSLQSFRQNRMQLLPALLDALETELANTREARPEAPKVRLDRLEYRTLTLVDDSDMDQDIVLGDIASRYDGRCHTALYLLGQRFGALAGSAPFEPGQVPLGPQSVCRALRASVPALQFDLELRLQFYKAFDATVLAEFARWLDDYNELLAQQGVLPGLVFAPHRARFDQKPAGRRSPTMPGPPAEGSRPVTGWQGQAPSAEWSPLGVVATATAADGAEPGVEPNTASGTPHAAPPAMTDAEAFAALQQLLSGRRSHATRGGEDGNPGDTGVGGERDGSPGAAALKVPLQTQHVLANLRQLQSRPIAARPGQAHRTMQDVQESLLAQVREEHGPGATLVQEDADTFELLGLLYNEIEREVQRDAPAVDLLVQLQVPMVQAALHDRKFFMRAQHPARELLNSVAESGARWLGDDEIDPVLLQKLQQAVARVVAEYHGDEAVFQHANNEVQGHFKTMARKAEVAERRHVEAARGKDRLEVAKRRAGETIDAAFDGRQAPKFVQTLLNQTWADVLTLSLLRNGDSSAEWQAHLDTTHRIAEVTTLDQAGGATDDALAADVEKSLSLVGYHGDEAAAVARRLATPGGEDAGSSRTELAARLKARSRLGESSPGHKKPVQLPRSDLEQECHQYLRTLPFGTWFEFIINQQGDSNRQRLSWFSPVTDNALFVNQRGQRVSEQSLDSLARLMARDQVRVVTQDKGRLIDRAWHATVNALRSLAGAAPMGTPEGANP